MVTHRHFKFHGAEMLHASSVAGLPFTIRHSDPQSFFVTSCASVSFVRARARWRRSRAGDRACLGGRHTWPGSDKLGCRRCHSTNSVAWRVHVKKIHRSRSAAYGPEQGAVVRMANATAGSTW
jgi:hypothetical protein